MAMTHPRLSRTDVREFIDIVVASEPDDTAVKGFLVGKEIDESGFANRKLEAAVRSLVDDCGSDRDSVLEAVEARHCGAVHVAIERFSDEALGDEEFWSYLAVRYFWRFISYRQASAWRSAQGEPPDPDEPESEKAKLERYIRGHDHYQIPLRLYLRAQAVGDGDDYTLTDIDGGGTDFWRSQVLGVRTGAYPPLARSVARAQSIAQLNVEEQRPPGRRVNRLRANLDFVLHDDAEAAAAINGLWIVTGDDAAKAKVKAEVKKSKKASKTPTRKPAKKKQSTKQSK